MKPSTLIYHFKESLKGFGRTGIMAMATISTIAVSLTILGAFLLFYANLSHLLEKLENHLQVSFYLKVDAGDQEIKDLVKLLRSDPRIRKFHILSKEDALEDLRKELGNNKHLLDNLEKNPLPDSIQVSLHPIKDWKAFRDRYESLEVISDSTSGQDWVEKLMKLISFSKTSGSVILIFLGIANLFIIANTIRLTVFARRQEIEIMRLVGATNWFIRTPFLMEGVLQGVVGALIASVFLGFGYSLLQDSIQNFFPGFQLLQMSAGLIQMHFKLVFLGVALGLLGSLFSLRKFLV
jgi:cell division transport system permease protein